ncbi:MAG: 1-acyl-sn-glycerol-3-phosphate acyltransferase [Alphaproteobacteria bacterium]|jgi:1-acyl-sn-glycerol-3-phosphate acyltransferase|nr:1-acyl-sn-glycerol-3-phosphate acyltransferase [Alphaproteobacteria bacterium]
MLLLRSALFNLAFYLWTAGMMILYLPAIVGPRIVIVRGMEMWSDGVMWLGRFVIGVKVEIRGTEHLPAGACLLAVKHQSAWDTVKAHHLGSDPAIVMKAELLWIPLYGWYSKKVGMIPVDRTAGAKALKGMLAAARAAAAAGRPIVIFPQGTRVAPGVSVPYQPGVAALYRDLGLPVVPVALNSGLFWPRRQFLRRPGTIVVEYLPPIPPGLDRRRFMAELETAIETATDRLVAEAQAGG